MHYYKIVPIPEEYVNPEIIEVAGKYGLSSLPLDEYVIISSPTPIGGDGYIPRTAKAYSIGYTGQVNLRFLEDLPVRNKYKNHAQVNWKYDSNNPVMVDYAEISEEYFRKLGRRMGFFLDLQPGDSVGYPRGTWDKWFTIIKIEDGLAFSGKHETFKLDELVRVNQPSERIEITTQHHINMLEYNLNKLKKTREFMRRPPSRLRIRR